MNTLNKEKAINDLYDFDFESFVTGITFKQLEELGCQICLANTYHLGHRPVSS